MSPWQASYDKINIIYCLSNCLCWNNTIFLSSFERFLGQIEASNFIPILDKVPSHVPTHIS